MSTLPQISITARVQRVSPGSTVKWWTIRAHLHLVSMGDPVLRQGGHSVVNADLAGRDQHVILVST